MACTQEGNEPLTDTKQREEASKWYHTEPLDVTLVEQKQTMYVDAETAVKILGNTGHPPAEDWRNHLPSEPTSANKTTRLPDADGITQHVQEPRPHRVYILGFDENRVHLVIARHVGNHLWHGYHEVEANLTTKRSEAVDELLDLDTFTEPFIRTVRGVGHGDSQERVHATLGEPDATRHTQALTLWWEYYFEEDVTIKYQMHVFTIEKGVPQRIRSREYLHLMKYRDTKPSDRSPEEFSQQ